MLQMNSTLKQLELQYKQDLTKTDVATNAEFQVSYSAMKIPTDGLARVDHQVVVHDIPQAMVGHNR